MHDESEPSLSTADARATELCAALVTDLARLLVVAPLYPPRHPRFASEARRVLGGMEHLLAPGEPLSVQHGDGLLIVQSHPVQIALGQFERLHAGMDVLGIETIEIDRDAGPDALHRLATFLLRERKQAAAAGTFAKIALDELPESVRVVRREFGQRVGWELDRMERAARITAAVDRLAEPVAGVVLDDEAQAACRGFAGKVFAGMAQRWEEERAAQPESDPEQEQGEAAQVWRPLEEMLDVGVQTIRGVLAGALESEGEGLDVHGLLEGAGGLLDFDAAATPEDLLVSLRGALEEAFAGLGDVESIGGDATQYELGVDHLIRLQGELEAHAEPLADLASDDRSEQISILWQCLARYPSPDALPAIEYELRERLTRELRSTERAVLRGAHRDLLATADPALVDFVLPRVWGPLRFSYTDPLSELIADVLRGTSARAYVAAWPHLVNELLLGLRMDDPAVAAELASLAARMARAPEGERDGALERLGRLEALTEDKLARSLFGPPLPEFFGLFEALLDAPFAGQVGRWLLRGFQQHPPPWPGGIVFSTFASPTRPCLRLMRAVVAGRCVERATDEVAARAAETLAIALDGLGPGRRREEWVAPALASLGALRHTPARPLLERVLRERRRLFLPAWPHPARAAARAALAALARRAGTAQVAA